MKRMNFNRILGVLIIVAALASTALAAGFTKTLTYADGTFNDVKSTSWYAKEVASAYELGFMNGKAEGQFVPDGNVSVAEAITMASRVHSIYNGKEIAKVDGGKWYDMYVNYALSNGIITEGQYDNFDRNIMRYEMAVMFADSMPESYFAAKNDVKSIPDVNENEEYHDKLMMLYNAGVVMGSTEYGDFLATNSIKRSETAAIINRVALAENRLSKTLKEYGDREQAVYLIDDYEMKRTVNSVNKLNSGWTFENTGNFNIDTTDTSSNGLADDSDTSYVAIHRNILTQIDGVVCFEALFTVSGDNGSKVYFSDSEGNILVELCQQDKKLVVIGDSEKSTDAAVADSNALYAELDLDNNKILVVLNGSEIGTFDMSSKAKDLSRVTFSTSKEYKSLLGVKGVHMYVNYDVNNMFITDIVGNAPYGWAVDSDVKISSMSCDKDTNSVTITGKGSAKKTFNAVSDKFVFETFVFAPEGQSGTVSLKSGDTVAVSVDVKDGVLTCGGQKLRDYHNNVWQLIRVEADTEKDTALIKINGKNTITVPFTVDSVDNIEITSESAGDFWFDDVEVYNVFDYADYCPTPVPVNDDGYYVGMSVCSLWREGSHYGWDCVSPYDEITPVLGYYDEGLPEVADWEIKMLVEHGFDFQHFCWYLGNTGSGIMKEPRLADAALHDGYFNAKYSNMIDFMLMWENNSNADCKDFNKFMNIWNYWCDWYFSDSRYFTINNKPVLTIYRYQKFVECFGDEAAAKKAVDFMKTDIRKLGYDGMIILMCDRGADAAQNKKFAAVGADAMVSYTFGDASHDAQFQKDSMNAALKAGSLPLLPSVGVGFNDLGWTEIRTPLATPEAHKEVYSWAKDTYLPKIAEKYSADEWMSKFVFATTWNEFGEGHYILPTNVCGFGYLDATRSTFSSVAGTADKAHFDVEPTINQKARLGYLYPAKTVPMRKLSLDDTANDIANNKAVIEWNFENEDACLLWGVMMNSSTPKYDAERKALVGTTTTNDGAIKTLDADDNFFDAGSAKYLLITLDTNGKAVAGNMFFKHNASDGWSGTKGYNFSAVAKEGFQNIIIDLSSNAQWKDEIQGLRFDPNDLPDEYVIKRIAFLSDAGEGSVTLNIDKTPHVVAAKQVKKIGNDVYVAGNPSDGFYSIHNLYYEYNRVNGTLMIKADNGKKMNLVVGSDVAVIDGKEKKLSAKIDIYDGLVFVPLKEIYDMAGFKYSVEKNGDFTVSVRPEDVVNAATQRVMNEYEFNVAGDIENWVVKCGTGNVANGVYGFTATPVTSTDTGFDPQIQLDGARIDTKYYKNVEIRFRASLANEGDEIDFSKVYFATDKNPGLAEKKSVLFHPKKIEPDAQGFYVINLDMSENEFWDGIVNTVRFDPANMDGYYEVDYIRFYADEKYMEELKKLQEAEEKRQALINAVNEGGPFYLENADAEDLTAEVPQLAGTTKLSIVEDDLRKGNHAYLLTPNKDKQTWSYFVVPTRYKAGVTYKVDFDVRLVSDHNGAPVETKVVVNPRYTDKIDGAVKERADHPENGQPISISSEDGWVKASVTFTVNESSPLRTGDTFTIFANPPGDSANFKNIVYMVDNFVISVVEPEEKEEATE